MTRRFNFYSVLDYENSEKYLDKMSRKGYILESFGMNSYKFEQKFPEDKQYQFAFLHKDKKDSKEELIQLFTDSGWEYVSSVLDGKILCLAFKSDSQLNLEAYNDKDTIKQIYNLFLSRFSNWAAIIVFPLAFYNLMGLIFFPNSEYIVMNDPAGFFICIALVAECLNRFRLYFKYKKKLKLIDN